MSGRRASLAVPVVVAGVLRLWDLAQVGHGNQYYAATVKSMTTSFAAFLYGAFDPALYVSVDKPAPGLWPQVLLAKAFGFSPLALLLPQAICGIASVAVLYWIVARAHGRIAAAIAALALAVAPVAVAVDRNNTMDAELVLVLLLACWCALRSLEHGPRWLLAAAALAGIGFDIKMSQALLAVPAILVTYAIAARAAVVARVLHLAGFALVYVAVAGAWIAVVDLTPASARPYVGSSRDNTALDLALGHNGAARLPQELVLWRRPAVAPQGPGAFVPMPPAPPAPAAGPIDEAGERGALRLFNEQLAGQVSWYIPLAFLGALAAFARSGPGIDRGRASVVLWLVWLVPAAVLFSWSGIFHRYYLAMLAPPLAALVGAGIAALVGLARSSIAWRAYALASAAASAALAIAIVLRVPEYAPWLVPVAVLGVLACAVAVVTPRIARAATAVAVATVFAAPVTWAATTLDAFDAGLPWAGPELLARRGPIAQPPQGRPGPQPPRRPALLEFLVSEHRGERWIAATSSQGTAAMLMLGADVAVMALGGFSGGDPILTAQGLEAKVHAGEVRFVLLEGRMQADLAEWTRRRCAEVPAARYGGSVRPPGQPGQPGGALFDCARVRQTR